MMALGQFGPAGMILAGSEFTREQRALLAESFEWLDRLLGLLKVDDFDAWASLTRPYLGDPADPSVLAHWRECGRTEDLEAHDRAVEKMAGWAEQMDLDLYIAWPSRMSSRREAQVERMNDEYYSLYLRLKAENVGAGMSERKANADAIRSACEMCGYSRRRGYEIIEIRSRAERAG